MPLLPTSLVGSYPQPDWLIDRDRLLARLPPRVRAEDLWRVAPEHLDEAWDDATRLAVHDQEVAGLDVVTDGEMRRESYSNRFATALEGVQLDPPGVAIDRTGHPNPVPKIVGRVRRVRSVERETARLLRAATSRTTKLTVPGPFTMAQQAENAFYGDAAELALDLAAAVNEELHELVADGIDQVQIDEPYLQARPQEAERYALPAIDRALEGITVPTVLHTCFGYAHVVHDRLTGYPFLEPLAGCTVSQVSIESAQPDLDPGVLRGLGDKLVVLGVLDLGDPEVESADVVAERVRRALEVVPAERLVLAPDCGMKYLPRDRALGKLRALVEGAAVVRRELGG
jgi:5-methyltetrahydropteroyltriglutamate--homocysteine methyltransferase